MVPFHMASSTAPHSEKQGEQQEKRIQRKAQKHEMGNTKMAIKPHSKNVTNFMPSSLINNLAMVWIVVAQRQVCEAPALQ